MRLPQRLFREIADQAAETRRVSSETPPSDAGAAVTSETQTAFRGSVVRPMLT